MSDRGSLDRIEDEPVLFLVLKNLSVFSVEQGKGYAYTRQKGKAD